MVSSVLTAWPATARNQPHPPKREQGWPRTVKAHPTRKPALPDICTGLMTTCPKAHPKSRHRIL